MTIQEFMRQNDPLSGIGLIAKERLEQVEKHGFSIQNDVDQNENRQLVWGAIQLFGTEFGYANDSDDRPDGWSEDRWLHMMSKPYKERLAIAGALIAAELDRLTVEDFQTKMSDPETII